MIEELTFRDEKKPYLVVVNRKWIVSARAYSNGGAEHVILDNYKYGIQTCQAFDPKEMHLLFDMFPDAETCNANILARICIRGEIEYLKKKAADCLRDADNLLTRLQEIGGDVQC